MDKFQIRAVIHYLYLKDLSVSKIKADMDQVLDSGSPSYETIRFWVAEFKRGRTNVRDDARAGRPNAVTTKKTIDTIRNLVLDDRSLKVRQIASMVNISNERAHNILNEHLHMKKIDGKWIEKDHDITDKKKDSPNR